MEMGVGFDDKITTILAQPENDLSSLKGKWYQLIDLLGQYPDHVTGHEYEAALAFLRRHRDNIAPSLRDQIIRSLPGRMSADLAAILSSYENLEHGSDFQSNPSTFQVEPSEYGLTQQAEKGEISRVGKQDIVMNDEATPSPGVMTARFRWETDRDGVIIWIDGASRGQIIGMSISTAMIDQYGVDGQAAGAFRRRAPFRDARFCIAGNGPESGDWRISGVPFFDPRRGIFLGYRGSARRPRADEVAIVPSTAQAGLFGTELQPDMLRQLVHELRTPLNAVLGFSELIDGQHLGPASDSYRIRAHSIGEKARQMLSAVEDLDTVARAAHPLPLAEKSNVDMASLLLRLHTDYARTAHHRDAMLEMVFSPDLPKARAELLAVERMCARLLAATMGLAEKGEKLVATLAASPIGESSMLCLSIARPKSIAGQSEAEILDPGYTPAGDWPDAPALGLGFALRLIGRLAESSGGKLSITKEHFILQLPAAIENTQRNSVSS